MPLHRLRSIIPAFKPVSAFMTLNWPARVSLILYFVLLALVSTNLVVVLKLSPWLAPPAPLLALGAICVFLGTRHALFTCLLVIGTFGLAVVALVLTVPAWQVIADGASSSWAGRMTPIFIAALALHACNLWVATMDAGEHGESVERLAHLLYGPGILSSLITAVILCAGTILGLELLARSGDAQTLTRRVLERGVIPPLTVLLFFWGALLLLGKWWNGWHLRRTLAHWRTAPSAGPSVAAGLDTLIQSPAGLDEGLQLLWRRHEESWLIPRYISWAVPVLGFIGTVLGISLAADGIRRIIASDTGLASLSSDLDSAIAPLGIAFDTTLIALSLSLVLTLTLALVQRGEERLLATLERRVREAARHA